MILTKIIEQTRKDLIERKRSISQDKLIDQVQGLKPARDFAQALCRPNTINIIAEAKKASPSKGLIRPDFDPVWIARCYEQSGAGAVSVLTEEHFFQGHLDYLRQIRRFVSLPIIRKDFIVDPYQVYEARAAGADAILLITAALELTQLSFLLNLTHDLGMQALVEVHTEEELHQALKANPKIIGINNRNLMTFSTDINTTIKLRALIPDGIITVSESGINTADDITRLRACGIDAFLIGESLMRETDPGLKLKQFLSA